MSSTDAGYEVIGTPSPEAIARAQALLSRSGRAAVDRARRVTAGGSSTSSDRTESLEGPVA